MISVSFMGMHQESGGHRSSGPWLRWGRSGQAGVPDMRMEVRETAGSLGPLQGTPAVSSLHCVPPKHSAGEQGPGEPWKPPLGL